MSEEEERRVGAEAHPKIMKEFGGAHGSLQLRSYVNKVGKALSQVSEMPNLPYKFTILNDKKVNPSLSPVDTSISRVACWY